MFFELIAAVTAGVLAAGAVLIANRVLGGRLPRWVMPVAAGAAIIAYAVYMEYTWYSRTIGPLPESMDVTFTHEARGVWRPWTFAFPVTDRFSVVDRASILSSEAVPEQRRADLWLFARWARPQRVPVVYDCDGARMTPLFDSVKIDDRGAVVEADWGPVPAGDPALEIVCKEARD